LTAAAAERDTTVEPIKKTYSVEAARFPLVWKLFGMTALLIVIVVALAIGITLERANRIASATVNTSISNAAKLFDDFERQRLGRLALPAELLGADSSFVAYIQTALSGGGQPAPGAAGPAPVQTGIDLPSIADQLEQRRQSFGSDLMILLDDEGRVIFRTDQPSVTAPTREDLYERSSLVKRVVDDNTVEASAGVLALGKRLYHAAVGPVATGANPVRIGYLVNGVAIDDAFANRIADSTNAGVMFVQSPKLSATPLVARSSNAPSVSMQQMASVATVFNTGRPLPPTNISVDGSEYVITAKPLLAGKDVLGAAVFLRSLDRELAPFKQIEEALLYSGGVALLLAFIVSWLIAKRLTHPIEDLAGLAQAVTAGDYTVRPAINRRDEVGILSRSFAKMITALRDKAELEELYEEMAAKSKERAASRPNEPAKLEEGTVLVTDLRGLPATVGEGDAAQVIATVARAMKLQEAEVQRQEGSVREVVGHRLVSIFPGDRGLIHAVRAARAIHEELSTQKGTQHPMTIGAGIATGEFVTGSVDVGQEGGLAIVGNAPLLASLFAWEASTGHALISYDAAQAVGGEVLASSTREEVHLKWLQNALPAASLPLVAMTSTVMRAMGTITPAPATLKLGMTAAGSTAPAGAPVELSVGQTFAGRYRIEQLIGRGGMGVVYKALDTQLDEVVAIKTLPGGMMQRSAEDLERFKREIRLARKITHRNVLRTYDYGEADGMYFISMEFVRGYTLSELLSEADKRQVAPRLAMGIGRQICRGLEVAHEQGIIHRDIKPQNVLIDHRGEVKIMDFGIARLTEGPEAMTQAGLIVGTPHYMSPEQVQGKALDPRSDVYALGVLLYEMLTGRRPFESTSLTGVLAAHITETPKPAVEVRPEIGREINAIIMKCLSKDPKQRYANAGELLHDLDGVQVSAAAAA
jgi:HAMP domain-containing protein/predicted Ser/Thr protein kinase